MELVGISDRRADFADRIAGHFQQSACLCHAVVDQEFLRLFADGFPEEPAEIAPVESGAPGDVFNCNLLHIVIFNEGECFFDIKIFYVPVGLLFPACGT